MNWVSGPRSQIRFNANKKLQKNFFQRRKYEEYPQLFKLPSPEKRQHRDVNMDLVSLHMVNHIACNDAKDNFHQVTKMTLKQSGSQIWHEHVELPSSLQAKTHAPSQLLLADGTSSGNSSSRPSAGHFMERSDFVHGALALHVVPSLVHYQNSDHKPKTPTPFQLDTTEHSLIEDDDFLLDDRGPALFLHGLPTSGHTSPRPWFEVEDPWWQQQHQQQLGLNPMQWGLGGPSHGPPQEYSPADMELASGFILQHLSPRSGLDSAFDRKITPDAHGMRDLLCFQKSAVAVPVQEGGGSCEVSKIWLQETAPWNFTDAHSVANDHWNFAPDQKINAHEQDHEEEEEKEESQPGGHSNRPRPPLQLRGAFPCREGDPLCHPKLLWTVPGCSTSSTESESSQVHSEMSDTDGDCETSATYSSPTVSASSGASTNRLSNQLVPTCTSDGPCVQRTAQSPTEVIPRPRGQKKEQWVEEEEQGDEHKVEEDRHEENEEEEQQEREEEEDAKEVADPVTPVEAYASHHASVQRDLTPEMQSTEYWRLLEVSHRLQKLQQQQQHQQKKLEQQQQGLAEAEPSFSVGLISAAGGSRVTRDG